MPPLPVPGAESVQALHVQAGFGKPVEDVLVIEGALQIALNGEAYSVTMRTPGDDAHLALGLLFTEGVIGSADDVTRWEQTPADDGNASDTVNMVLADPTRAGLNPSNRRLVSNASCGVCGKISAEDLEVPSPRASGSPPQPLDLSRLPSMEGAMRSAQALFAITGGSHAAAVFAADGALMVLKEDVGRHNAVDKAIGHLFRHGLLAGAAALFISGRVSYEIVTKASKAGIAFLLAVSAPSTLAVKLCRDAGITLVAFVRGGKATVYTHPQNVIGCAGNGAENAEEAEDAERARGRHA